MQTGVIKLENSHSIRELFKEVFKCDISTRMLDWKYIEGRGYNIAFIDNDGDIIGHVGGVYRKVFCRKKT